MTPVEKLKCPLLNTETPSGGKKLLSNNHVKQSCLQKE